MTAVLEPEVLELLNAPETLKVLATVDEAGVPHTVVKGSLHADEEGNLIHLELIERSRTNRNLVGSIWHDRPVSVLLAGKGGRSYQIAGLPLKVHVSGPVFQKHYLALREKLGDVDLAGVWIIQPQLVIDQSWATRLLEEGGRDAGVLHLDRLVQA